MHNVYFRADGSNAMGVGHIYRCCALAQILERDFNCVFLINRLAELEIIKVVALHFSRYYQLQNDEEALEVAGMVSKSDIVVLDGYHFDTEYQQTIKSSDAKLVCIDDIAQYPFVADVVINHAGGISRDIYSLAPDTRLFLGPEYAIIRKPFVDFAKKKMEPIPGRIMIAMGGADPNNYTSKILNELLAATPDSRDIHVVAGAKFHFLSSLVETAENQNGVTIHQNIDGKAMAALMATASTCIATPSTVAFEFFTCSKGRFVMQVIASNQMRFAEYLKRNDFALDYSDFSCDQLNASISTEKVSLVFDGNSYLRIINIFKLLYNE
ncbi:MAG: UDP-2,4-diacetamido-2,4,6-trideoxy-beta-L-altropyranose hydrolase [Bacteroidetes bacterium]|nr:UDP-2,4-diacetamido-2,4,6-trideoxy-beta-L-altropyranose hydrolase [Bacteroidota bacterium]